MKKYVGVKIISATPSTCQGKEGYQVIYQDGYESWSPKDVFEEAYRVFNYNTLPVTAKMMLSADYKERFLAEYLQLKIRIEGLSNMLEKYAAGTLPFKPSCSMEVLEKQLRCMNLYRICLEERATIENIDLIMK